MINKVLIVIVFSLSLNAAVETSSSLTKQKMEVLELKNELNNFYNEKEKEYQRQKKELEDISSFFSYNLLISAFSCSIFVKILKEIRSEVVKKSIRVFELMKAKVAAEIFDQMILEGKIDDVFDIIVRLKEANVSNIMKTMSLENSSRLIQKLERYNKDKQKRD